MMSSVLGGLYSGVMKKLLSMTEGDAFKSETRQQSVSESDAT